VKINLEPTARLSRQVQDPKWTTTEEDLPPAEVELFGVPRIGDEVEDPETGRNWVVARVAWFIGGGKPLLIVE
jgi:hypothetical protein